MYEIYCVTNKESGKKYIGQTIRGTAVRWSRHCTDAISKPHLRYHFYNALRKYGKDAFEVETIATCDSKEWADYLERMWILLHRTLDPTYGYNATSGGEGGLHREETKAKIGEASRSWWEIPENRERASASRKGLLVGERNPMYGRTDLGKPHTEETRQLLSEQAKERFSDPEYKSRMSEANRGKKHTPEGKANISKSLMGHKRNLGRVHTEEDKAKISEGLKRAIAEGRRKKPKGLKPGTKLGPMSDEEKSKRSAAMKKYVRTPEHEAKRRAAHAAAYERKRLAKMQ